MAEKILLAGDVDAIKNFVFETSSLPQIRGGSELLLECEAQIREALRSKHGYTVIYCGGGTFLLETEAAKAEEIKRDIESLYLDYTSTVTITIVYEESPPTVASFPQPMDGWSGRLLRAAEESFKGGDFSFRSWKLAAKMREAKRQKMTTPFYEAFPFGKRCSRCGRRMAAYPDRVEESRYLCPVCNLRDKQGRERKRLIHGQDIRGRFNQEFWKHYGKDHEAKQPEDLDMMLSTGSRGYLAFVYVDGNNIGRLLHKVRSVEEYHVLSNAITRSFEQALYKAIGGVCDPALKKNGHWPFDIVNVGGDDVTLLIQAGYAWEIAIKLLEQFEHWANEQVREDLGAWPELLTASCGIAIADVKYPMRYFERLAGDLCAMAKKLAKKDPLHPTSTVTFLWLPTPVASEKAEPLMSYYTRHPAKDLDCRLTARPYTLEQARELLLVSREIAKWPRTLRHRWAKALEQGVMFAVNVIHYDIARRNEDERQSMYQTLIRVGRLVMPSGEHNLVPAPIWYQAKRDREVVWQTALLDALELAELESMRPEAEEETE